MWEEERPNLIKQFDNACCNSNSVANERDKLLKERIAWEYEWKDFEKQIEELNVKIDDITNEGTILHKKRDFETEKAH